MAAAVVDLSRRLNDRDLLAPDPTTTRTAAPLQIEAAPTDAAPSAGRRDSRGPCPLAAPQLPAAPPLLPATPPLLPAGAPSWSPWLPG